VRLLCEPASGALKPALGLVNTVVKPLFSVV
jgi:hypothetical protein